MPDFSKVQKRRPLVVTASTAISLILWFVITNLTTVAGCFPAAALLVPCDCDFFGHFFLFSFNGFAIEISMFSFQVTITDVALTSRPFFGLYSY